MTRRVSLRKTLAPGAAVLHVARRNGLMTQQLFTWRRQARERTEARERAVTFAPVVLAAPPGRGHQGRGDDHRDRDRRDHGARSAGCGRGDAEAGSASREGSLVIVPASGVRVLIATKPVDFRKGMDGVSAAVVRESLGADPYGGVIHVFRAKRADRVKLLFWDGSGARARGKAAGTRLVPPARRSATG